MGVKIFSDASVNAIGRRGYRFSLQTGAGSVKADRVLLCTKGYTDPSLGPIGRSFALIPSHPVRSRPTRCPRRCAAWPYRWGGLVAITTDQTPHVHEPVPGLVMALGYNGRGGALATRMGAAIADYAMDGDEGALPIPLTPIKRFPFHRLRAVGLEVVSAWFAIRDRMAATDLR